MTTRETSHLLSLFSCSCSPGRSHCRVCDKSWKDGEPAEHGEECPVVELDGKLSSLCAELAGNIMNIPARVVDDMKAPEFQAYRRGHRDARHEAAELVTAWFLSKEW